MSKSGRQRMRARRQEYKIARALRWQKFQVLFAVERLAGTPVKQAKEKAYGRMNGKLNRKGQ